MRSHCALGVLRLKADWGGKKKHKVLLIHLGICVDKVLAVC